MLDQAACSILPAILFIVQFGGCVYGLNGTNAMLNTPGDTVVLQCFRDVPGNLFRWFKVGDNPPPRPDDPPRPLDPNGPNKPIRPDVQIVNIPGKYAISDDNNTLTIMNAGESDVGLYLCRIQNDIWAEVNLFSRPVLSSFKEASVAVIQGDALDLQCYAWGWPTPNLIWYRGKDVINFKDAVFADNGTLRSAFLHADNVTSYYQAIYTCLAFNPLGFSNVTTSVRVKDRLAALWPFIGILVEAVLAVLLIFIFEAKRKRKLAEELSKEE